MKEDGTVTEYAYDAENIRVSEITGDIKTVYVTDREAEYSQLLYETTYQRVLGKEVKTGQKTYFYGKGLIAEKDNSSLEKRYYHYNNIGSTTEVTANDGSLLYRFAYDTYGELVGITDENGESLLSGSTVLSQILAKVDIRFLYNGQFGIETEDNGLYYMRARYYNPQIKRFINRDILEGDITDSQTLNRYSYVLGNPVSLTDPFGLCASDYWSNAGHEALDWLGFIFGGADAVNAVWYTAEGNIKMAGISTLGILPFGSAAGKFGKEIAQESAQKAVAETTEEAIEQAAKKTEKEAWEEAAEQGTKKSTDGKSKTKNKDDKDFGNGKDNGGGSGGDDYDAGSRAKDKSGGNGGNTGGKGGSARGKGGLKSGKDLIKNIRKIEYGTDELSKVAIEFRKANNITSARRNVCVVEYKNADGTIVQKAFASNTSNHSEELMIDFLKADNISGEDVIKIFTEREPCVETATNVGHNCTNRIMEYTPNAEVAYAVEYGVTQEDGLNARNILQELLQNLLK